MDFTIPDAYALRYAGPREAEYDCSGCILHRRVHRAARDRSWLVGRSFHYNHDRRRRTASPKQVVSGERGRSRCSVTIVRTYAAAKSSTGMVRTLDTSAVSPSTPTRKVRMLQVRAGGFLGLGERHFLIPMGAVASVDQNREHVLNSPAYDPNLIPVPMSECWEPFYGYYGGGIPGPQRPAILCPAAEPSRAVVYPRQRPISLLA